MIRRRCNKPKVEVLLEKVLAAFLKQTKEIKKMAKTQDEALARLTALEEAATAQLDSTKSLIDLVKELRTVIVANPSPDFTPFIERIDALTGKLVADNEEVEGTLNPTTPENPPA